MPWLALASTLASVALRSTSWALAARWIASLGSCRSVHRPVMKLNRYESPATGAPLYGGRWMAASLAGHPSSPRPHAAIVSGALFSVAPAGRAADERDERASSHGGPRQPWDHGPGRITITQRSHVRCLD